ncbi:ATP-binding protein [Mesobacillus subterraneus]|uniref:sensor histidine kinase n=1 Tax=Mesobacillus subterraneus TaxID=285983 RepID=UPI00203E9EEB|nr:ATP-binding protein [Mesobacillus subterraneus]MCM3663385.1 ATP-binding protein [Mesobacillus subterraneus]MCM3683156.1 ATP-binding protein [Mesobacillus subterraneus]
MLKTLRSKILFYFLLVSLTGILVVSFSLQWGFEASFNHYINENRTERIEQLINALRLEYKEHGTFTGERVSQLLHEQAMTDSLYYKLYTPNEILLMDSTTLLGILEGIGFENNPYQEDNWLTSTETIKIEGKAVGKLKVYYPKGFIDSEYVFLQKIQKYLVIAVALTIILALFFSMLFSKRLTSGLKSLAAAVEELTHHKQNVRVPLDNLSLEMKQLGIAFNDLAMSLEKEERLRKEFTGDLAHELRTPLATLRSQIEAFQDGIWQPTPERLKQSHNELMRLVRLVNELEKLLAAENPQIRLEKTEIEAGALLQAMQELVIPAFRQKEVGLNVILPGKSLWFLGDRDKVVQILTNIVNNALKYTPEKGEVTISAVEEEQMAGFRIQDKGMGISSQDLPHIFERFYRGDKSRDRKTGGVGIGLSIVKALVEAHKGKISVESELENGSSFTILFPKHEI